MRNPARHALFASFAFALTSAVSLQASADDAATVAPSNAPASTTVTDTTTSVSDGTTPVQTQEPVVTEHSYTTTTTSPNLQLTSPSEHPYVDKEERKSWPNRSMLSTGATVLTLSYIPAVIAAAAAKDTSNDLYIPVAGPWLEIANQPNNNTNTALLAIDGVFQGLGALTMLGGLLIPERNTENWYLIGNNRFNVLPAGGRASLGLRAAGRF